MLTSNPVFTDILKAAVQQLKGQGAEAADIINALADAAIDIAWEERLAGAGLLQEASIAFARAAGNIRATSVNF